MSEFTDKLAAVDDLQRIDVPIPEWDMTIQIREIPSGVMRSIRKKYIPMKASLKRTDKGGGKSDMEMVPEGVMKDMDGYHTALLLAAMWYKDKPCFENEAAANKFLGERSQIPINKIVAVIVGMSEKALPDEAEENLDTTPED